MERIGLIASKMSKGNLVVYNLCVIVLAFLFSLLIFFMAGASILLSLFLLRALAEGLPGGKFSQDWSAVIFFCMVALTVVVGIMNTIAVIRNIKLGRKK